MDQLSTYNLAEWEATITSLILDVAPCEKIYLLGSTLMQRRTETVFTTKTSAWLVSHFYILAIIKGADKQCNNTTQDKIENHCGSFIPVTAIVIHADHFNEWLTEGHRFACQVVTMARCLHDTGERTLPIPPTFDEQEFTKINKARYNAGINKVQEFIAGADLYRIRAQNKLAAFMLHQAAEQALHTLFRITTGMYVNTHNIEKLMRYCSMVSCELPAIFPRNNDKNERLFQLLQKAYIDARYKEDYAIGIEDLLILTERIRAIEGIVKESYAPFITYSS